ncbi:MAG: SLC13 family permease, partial [Gammaproteobacteria bacterium]|nr:SLC13 family permease [Gammaproteobacteria bacterium]
VGTPPNLLVSGALADAGYQPFGLFDFTPLGLIVLVVGSLFVAYIGRHLLPGTSAAKDAVRGERDLQAQYGLHERMFLLRVPAESVVVGRSIDDVGLEWSAGLIIIALMRSGSTRSLPPRDTRLLANDLLLVQGRADRFDAMGKWADLTIEREAPLLKDRLADQMALREVQVAEGSRLVGEPLRHGEFRSRHKANVLALRRGSDVRRSRLAGTAVAVGDRMLVQCIAEHIGKLEDSDDFATVATLTAEELTDVYHLDDSAFVIHVPHESDVVGQTLGATRLADAFDFRLIGVFAMRRHSIARCGRGHRRGDLIIVEAARKTSTCCADCSNSTWNTMRLRTCTCSSRTHCIWSRQRWIHTHRSLDVPWTM